MSLDGAGRRKERLDELAARIRECGNLGVSFSAAVDWSMREQGITDSKAREFIKVLVRSLEVKHDIKADRLFYVQRRGMGNVATP